jgi:AbiV family abortive infection protein
MLGVLRSNLVAFNAIIVPMKKPSPKKKPLTPSQMHQGFMMALEQAEHLAHEARVLARRRLFAGALSKAVLGLEEIGKNRLMLYQAATLQMGRPVPWQTFWRAYRNHREKLLLAMMWSSILNRISSRKTH